MTRQLHALEWLMIPVGAGKTTSGQTPTFTGEVRTLAIIEKGNEPPEPLITHGEIVDIDDQRYEVLGWEAFAMHLQTQRGPLSLLVRPVAP